MLRKAGRNPQHFSFAPPGKSHPASEVSMNESQRGSEMILTKEERLRILDAPDRHSHAGIRDRAILELLGGAGLKVRELAALRIENIDLQISCILLPGGAQRMIPFGSRTRESLMNYLYDVRGEVEGPGSLLFPGRGGEQLTRQAVWKIVRKYALSAGIGRGVSPEDLRTSLAVSLLRGGTDPAAVQSLLGIRRASMQKYYDIAGCRD